MVLGKIKINRIISNFRKKCVNIMKNADINEEESFKPNCDYIETRSESEVFKGV